MGMNVVKKVTFLLLVITLLIVPSASFAITQNEEVEVPIVQPRWSYLYECENALDITENESRKLTLYASTELYEGCAGIHAQLQKMSSDGSRWDDVEGKEWECYSEDYYASIYDEDISVSAGTYRCYLVHTATDEYGMPLETFTAYTRTVTVY